MAYFEHDGTAEGMLEAALSFAFDQGQLSAEQQNEILEFLEDRGVALYEEA